MPPARLNLQRFPLAAQGSGSNAQGDDSDYSAPRPAEAATDAVGVHVLTRSLTCAWLTWPLAALSNVHSVVRGWFASLDAVLLEFPRGIGPAISALIRLLSLAIAASIISCIVSRTTSGLLKLSSRAPAAVVDPYTPGRHSWVAARSRWDPHHCSICSGVIAWVSDSGVRCQICGSHAHTECSKRAHREGFACKALCSSDVEVAHRRLFHTQVGDDQAYGAVPDDWEKKPPPAMRHQWMRGSIDDSRRCSGCGENCAGSGASGQRGFFCAWCKQQVHEGCVARVSEAECTLGRHRRLILPPIAVLKDHPRRKRKGDIIREAVSKVRSVLPGQNDPPASPAYHNHNRHHPAVPAPMPGSGPQQGFVEAVKEAAAAMAAAATEVELDVAERVRGAVPFRGEDDLWEAALGDAGWPKEGDEAAGANTAASRRFPGEGAIDEAWGQKTLTSAAFSAGGSSADLPGEASGGHDAPAGVRSTSPIGSGKGGVWWSKGSWAPALKRGSSYYDGIACDSSGRGGVEGGRATVGDGRVSNEMRRRWRSVTDKMSKRHKLAEYSSVGEAGNAYELPVGELETRTHSEFFTAEASGVRGIEQAQPKPLAREPDGEKISSKDTTVEAGVLKPVSVDDSVSVAERRQKERTPGEPSTENLATRDDSSVVDGHSRRSWRGECDDRRLDGSDPELRENEARERQEEEEGQEDDEREWVVKMQELIPRHQTSGEEGSDATKAVSCYTRKTRCVTLTICEDKIPEDSCPLLVFVNSKSGGKQGGVLISRFRELLNPLQISDLSSEDPLEVLQRFRNVLNLRLLVCGGDGTVAWLLQAVDAISWKGDRPPLAVLPLGTGNDLARVLGWGNGYAGEGLHALLDTIESAQVTMLDRWSVSVSTACKGAFRKTQRSKDRQVVMNNYIGIGVDGQVALDFHKMRESRPVLFFNRAVNKVLYAQLGVRSALARAYRDLPARLELRCDGRLVELPETTASIVALNINSFGGGSKLWAVEETEPSRRGFATGKVANHPLDFPSTQHATMWAFNAKGVVTPGESASLPSGASVSTQTMSTGRRRDSKMKNGRRAGLAAAIASEEFNAKRGGGGGGGSGTSIGFGQPAGEFHPSDGRSDGSGASDARASDGVGSFSSSESREFSDAESGEGIGVDRVRPGRVGSTSVRRGSKSSFHDGLLEVVAVEGVLHFGQIQLGLSRALPVAQCREVQIRTLGTLPMQVDGEPWTQPPSEITVKMHNQAAMLRPATATERAVASVLSDVGQAIGGAQEDLVINERQARALLSRIRRTARIPDGSNNDDLLS